MIKTKTAVKCPICKKQSVPDVHPFCSKRCKMIDLGKWLKGDYAIPTKEEPSHEEEEEEV